MTRLRRRISVQDFATILMVMVAAGILVWMLAPTSGDAATTPLKTLIDARHIRNVQGRGPVAIVEFSDFECPFCSQYSREAWPAIKRSLIDSGEARYVAMHYPLERIHPLAIGAAEAAECAAHQGKYWPMHDRLFAHKAALAPAELPRHAKALDLDEARFAQCLDSDETLETIRAQRDEGWMLGVRGTPEFLIGTLRADGGIDIVTRIDGIPSEEVLRTEVAAVARHLARRSN